MDGLVDLVGQAYDTALDPAGLGALLDSLAERLRGPAAIQRFDVSRREASFERAVGLDPEALREYREHDAGQPTPHLQHLHAAPPAETAGEPRAGAHGRKCRAAPWPPSSSKRTTGARGRAQSARS
jgi:hypothetical protein